MSGTARVTVARFGGRDPVTGRGYPPGTRVTKHPGGGWAVVGGQAELDRASRVHRNIRAANTVEMNRPGTPCASCGQAPGTVHRFDRDGHGGWVCQRRPPGFTPCAQLPAPSLSFALG